MERLGRRRVLRWSAGALAGGLLATVAGCTSDGGEAVTPRSTGGASPSGGGRGRLRLDLRTPAGDVVAGTTSLGITSTRDALVRVPAGATASVASPLVLLLHGAGGDAAGGMSLLADLADEAGVVLVAISSRGPTWDVLVDDFGVDVEVAGRALAAASERAAVDPGRLAVGGFSDGASYALSLGLTNGDVFGHVLALSPGFAAPAGEVGRPRCYVSHGTGDRVLPIDRCSRRIVPSLRARGYDVTYTEFDGGHEVPTSIAREALASFASP
jgi:predicted esterase